MSIELTDDQRAALDTIALEAHSLDEDVRRGLAKDPNDWVNDFWHAAASARLGNDYETAAKWDGLSDRTREALES